MIARLAVCIAFVLTPALAAVADVARVPQSRAEMQLSFAPLVREAAPAVVNIYAKRVVETRRRSLFDDPFFADFFDRGPARPRVENSLGSGVVVSASGLVVSNYHVVGQASEIRVVLNDRREYGAELLLADAESDLAILQLEEGAEVPWLRLRDSDTVEVGELVLAIGNPFGVGQTVTSGIVSGLARSGTATGNARGYFIQTDAPINPGNSGGALIDVEGQLIGINTSILSRSGGSNGIGFAIPASLVAEFLRQAEAGETRFQRPWAGLGGQAVDQDLAEGLGLPVPGGVILNAIHPASPFAGAGFRQGDVVTHVDGMEVNTPPEMLYRMSVAGLGGEAVFTRFRGGETEEVPVTLIAAPDTPARDETVLGRRDILEGVTVMRVNPAVEVELRLPFGSEGVVVADPGPLGARVGLRAGDIVEAVDRRAIEAPADLGPALRDAGRRVMLTLRRAGSRVVLNFRV